MGATTRSSLIWLAACALGLAVPVGPLAAQTYDSIKLQVPVKLKNMHPQAKLVVVDCEIRDSKYHELTGKKGWVGTIQGGELDQVVPLVFSPKPGKTFVDAKTSVCSLRLIQTDNPKDDSYPPLKGSPPSAHIWRLGKPDEYFMQTFNYPLDGAKFVPGISGSKELTIQPKQKE